jgi:hypothetical protein
MSCGVRPEFTKPNLLPVVPSVALFTRRDDYARAMHEIGIREENWHAWPREEEAWVFQYANGERQPQNFVVVCIGDTDGLDGIDIAAILCHEAVHVWQAYAEFIGERRPADEQAAYAIQSIAKFLMREFVRLGGTQKI